LEWLRGHGNDERALEAERDGSSADEVFGNGVNQLDDLCATAVAFDSCFVRVATGPAKRPVGTEPMSAQ
jgi:hypothetical protein